MGPTLQESFVGKIILVCIPLLLGGTGWLTTQVMSQPTRAEVEHMINRDREHLVRSLGDFKENQRHLIQTVDKLKEKIEDVRVLLEKTRMKSRSDSFHGPAESPYSVEPRP